MEATLTRVDTRLRTLAFLPLLAASILGSPARAENFVVTASEDEPDADPGDGVCASDAARCTLRAAIEETNADYDFDTIYVSPAHYVLEHGPLVFNGQVEVFGRNAEWTIIDANLASRVIELAPRDGQFVYARLTAVTLTNGNAGAPGDRGGAVLIPDPAALFGLDRAIVRNNFAASGGGAIFNAGNLDISRSAITENESDAQAAGDWDAAGGGIYNSGSVSIARSSISGNWAVRGGGLANESGNASILNTTFSDNFARDRGGAVSNQPGQEGANPRQASADLSFVTIVSNRVGYEDAPGSGGGIYNAGGLWIASSIIARNTDFHPSSASEHAPDCVSETQPGQASDPVTLSSSGGIVLGVYNARCEHDAHPLDRRGSADLPLDPGLSDTSSSSPGEVTFGFEPYEDSPAVDSAGPDFCVYEDQWGFGRPGSCDSGAIERSGPRRRRSVMMVVGNREFTPTDLILSVKLAAAGFDIVDETPAELSGEVLETNLTLISETVSSAELPDWLATVEKPILCLEPGALDNLHMTEEGWGRTQGVETNASRLRVMADGRVDSSLVGEQEVTNSGAKLGWGVPATSEAFKQAELLDAPGHWAIFGYDTGALLADGSRAPAPRVAFFAADGTPQRMNSTGWNLFDGLLYTLAPPPP
jgi:CSLREA domain-containing protein